MDIVEAEELLDAVVLRQNLIPLAGRPPSSPDRPKKRGDCGQRIGGRGASRPEP
jgi:hypothetical protein